MLAPVWKDSLLQKYGICLKTKAFKVKTLGKCSHSPEGLLVVKEFNLSRLHHFGRRRVGSRSPYWRPTLPFRPFCGHWQVGSSLSCTAVYDEGKVSCVHSVKACGERRWSNVFTVLNSALEGGELPAPHPLGCYSANELMLPCERGGWVNFRAAIDVLVDIKNLLLPPGIETMFLRIQPVTQSLYSVN